MASYATTTIAGLVLGSLSLAQSSAGDVCDAYSFWGFGFSAASLGDIDGDARSEFVVGVPGRYWTYPPAVLAYSGSNRSGPLYEIHGSGDREAFLGRTMVAMGDLDGDGAGDFATSGIHSVLRIASGRSGRTLHDLPGDMLPDGCWFALPTTGSEDVDGDGLRDLILGIGSWWYTSDPLRGGLAVISGRDGCLIRLARWPDWFARGAAGDADRDGCGDILVSTHHGGYWQPVDIMFRVLSGTDLRVLSEFTFSSPAHYLHLATAPLRDANGDGFTDLAVGLVDESRDRQPSEFGRVMLVSGRDGSELRTLVAGAEWNMFGYSVAEAGDVDFDGCSDVLVGSYADRISDRLDTGSVFLFSGRSGELLRRWIGTPGGPTGHFVGNAGDLNADGFPDHFAGSVQDRNEEYFAGSLFLISGFDGSILDRLGSALHQLSSSPR